MRGLAVMVGGSVWLAAAGALAQEPAAKGPASSMPVDGAVAFSYSRADDLTACSQSDEAAVRSLIQGVMRVDPFVPAGQAAPFTVAVRTARTRGGQVRATFELLDAQGASKGVAGVEDPTCDGAHLKLVGSLALLLAPAPTVRPPPAHGNDEAGAAALDTPSPTPARTATRPEPVASTPGPIPAPTPGAAAAAPPAPAPGSSAETATPIAGIARGAPSSVCKLPFIGYCVGVDIYSVAFTAGGVMSLGLTADPGPGAYLGAELRPIENISVGLELRGMFPSRVVFAEPVDPSKPYGSPKEPDVSNVEVLAGPCFRYWWLMGCGIVHLGFSLAQSPAELTGWPVVGAGPRIGIEIPFAEQFFVRIHGDALFNFINTTSYLDDQNLKREQDVVSGFIGVGLGVNVR